MSDIQKLFRPKALERLTTPERLDLLLRVSAPRTWIPLLALGLVFAFAVGWSLLGRLLVTVDGRGVLLLPHAVVTFQAPSGGQVREIRAQPGTLVKKGDLLAVIDLPELRKDLEQQTEYLVQLKADQAMELDGLKRRLERERSLLTGRKEGLEKTLARRREFYDSREAKLVGRTKELRALADSEKKAALDLIASQRGSFAEPMKETEERIVLLQRRLDAMKELRKAGSISESEYLVAQGALSDESHRKSNIENQIDQLSRDEQEAARLYNQRLNAIQDVEIQIDQNKVDREALTKEEQEIQQVSVEEARLEQEESDMKIRHDQRLQEAQRKIDRLTVSVEKQGTVHAEFDALVIEVQAAAGQVVSQGRELGSLMRVSGDSMTDLHCVAYFTVNDGKRVETGQTVQVTPDTVKRERFGSIVGRVESVEIYPVTTESVVSLVGNRELAESLTSGGKLVQARIRLERNPQTRTGFAWTTSRGPDLLISCGTTAGARVVVEERRPISYIVPFLRSLGGE